MKQQLKLGAARLIRTALRGIYAPIKLLPTQDKITLISRQQDSPSLDFQVLMDELSQQNPTWKIDALCFEFHSSTGKKLRYVGHVLRQMVHISRSRLVIVDTYCIPVSVLTHKKSLRVIQMWHALGNLKKFGYSILDVGEGASSGIARTMHMHANYDAVLTSSQNSAPSFAEAFDVPLDTMKVISLPRTDVLRDQAGMAQRRAQLIARYPELATGKNVLFAPTFQKGSAFRADQLSAQLKDAGYHLIAKPHPVAVAHDDVEARRYRAHSTFDFLAVADILVTDYSSIMFEAGVAGVPVAIFAPNFEQYLKERDFYIDFATEVPSPISRTVPELIATLDSIDSYNERLAEFTHKYVNVPVDRTSTAELVDLCSQLIAQSA